ncbi:MAG TPA: lysophospholipid acyltransferase family protein [Gemmatimonadaceae bacterium]|nr:lysophospholipid acyltransferase family protein [Gemmatimonadaceae bacterium]
MSDDEGRAKRRSRRITWAVRIGAVLLRLLAKTWRFREIDGEYMRGMGRRGEPYIAVLWHGELLPLIWWHRNRGIALLVSEHGDGEIIARVARSIGYEMVRGSSSRGADRALLELIRVVSSGRAIGISPDGPRGPEHTFAAGALLVSHRSRAPIILVRASASRAWRLRSWDRFLIPKPFARVTVAYAEPQTVVADSARDAAAQAPRFKEALLSLGSSIGA